MNNDIKLYIPQLIFNKSSQLKIGPIHYVSSPDQGIQVSFPSPITAIDASALLYLIANIQALYNDKETAAPEPYFRHAFLPEPQHPKTTIDTDSFDHGLVKALDSVLNVGQLHYLQTLHYLVESMRSPVIGHQFIFLALGFEALFDLNPQLPTPDLRQRLRPLLHLKFSQPIELMWKWVEQFYAIKTSLHKRSHDVRLLFLENPNVSAPLLLIGQKLLIYALYDTLFLNRHLSGVEGTASTPDDFKKIHPENVLLFFWSEEMLLRKITLLEIQHDTQANDKDLQLLKAIWKKMHRHIRHSATENLPKELRFQPSPPDLLKEYSDLISRFEN